MKKRRLKKVMAGLLAALAFTVMIISVRNTLTVNAAEGDAAVVKDSNGVELGSYATLPEAFVAAKNGDTICIVSDINEPSMVIGHETGEKDKHIVLDLNNKSVTLQTLNIDRSLYVKNGTLNCDISNSSVGFIDNAALTLSNVRLDTPSLNWMTDSGISLKDGSVVNVDGFQCWFEQLHMDKDCVLSVKNTTGLGNYGHIADGLDSVKEFVPEGLSIKDTTIVDDATGNKAGDFVLRYRSFSDASEVVTDIDPKSYVYDGAEKKPKATVSYGGMTLTEGISYTCEYKNNIDAGTAKVIITGIGSMHGQTEAEFIIDKAKQKAPTGLVPTAESIDGKNDGQISNLDTSMEYSIDKKNWTACNGTLLKDLSDGNYYVRYKETKNYYASPAAKVVVGKGKTAADKPSTTEEPTTEKVTTEEQSATATATEEVTTEKQSADDKTDAVSTADKNTAAAAPNTGDGANVILMFMLIMGCLLVSFGVAVYKRKR